MIRHFGFSLYFIGAIIAATNLAAADPYDPPAGYYSSATGTGATLKSQLHTIVKTGSVALSYDSARTNLQVTDADPNNPGHMLSVYDRQSINVAAINPGSTIPGWDGGATWNREHTWPQSRGISSTSPPDGTDLFELRPSSSSTNGSRSNLNYGGAFGQTFGRITDNGATVWYPGDADAGMVAREEFFMATRYDGTESGTNDLELAAGNPASGGALLGDLNRMVEWNYAAPPDAFERRRNQVIYDNYQHNRDPFTDHPEWVWSVFVNQANNSQIALGGATAGIDGSSTKSIDLGSVLVGGSVPGPQNVTLNKAGTDGTYFEVTASGDATSTLAGHFNAFRTNQADSKTFSVGLNTSTATAGPRSGSVTIDNLDVTGGAGTGHGANDGNDAISLSLAVLDHANASFVGGSDVNALTIDFGTFAPGSGIHQSAFSLYNLIATAGFTAPLDLLGVTSMGNDHVLTTDLSLLDNLTAGGGGHAFQADFNASSPGAFSATYLLTLSDDTGLTGAVGGQQLQLHLVGSVVPEPPTIVLGCIAALIVWRKRRDCGRR
jgi:endonuclease I